MSDAIPPKNTEWTSAIESRRERADYYFTNVLEGQREWYSNKAGTQKKQHFYFAIAVIVLGALVSSLQALDFDWVRYCTAILGAAVTIVRAIDTFLHPGETWQTYRKASERMKREYRLYINNSDAYTSAPDEDAAYRLFVERVESAIAEEQQLFWQPNAKTAQPQPAAEADEAQEEAK